MEEGEDGRRREESWQARCGCTLDADGRLGLRDSQKRPRKAGGWRARWRGAPALLTARQPRH